MKRNIFGAIAALALLGSLMGLAMASPSEATSELAQADSLIPDNRVSSTTPAAEDDSRTSTSIDDGDDSTSTTIDDRGNDDGTTSTSIDDKGDDDGTTSTTSDDKHDDDETTSTTIDDHGTVIDQVLTKEIPGVGTVTVEVRSGRVELVSVSAPGWDIAVEAESTDVKVKFRNGSSEVEYEAELEDGRVKIEIEKHTS